MKIKIGLAIIGGIAVLTLSLFGVKIIIDQNKVDELLKKLEPEYLSRKAKKKDLKVDEKRMQEIRALLDDCDKALANTEYIGEEVLRGEMDLGIDVV